MYIFLDTTSNLTLGLLDQQFNWLTFEKITTKRTSEILHEKIHSILTLHSLSIDDVKVFFSISGPGSYTGMRVSEGFNQVLELEDKKIISFPSYLLAEFCDKNWDFWAYPAFKNEIFLRNKKGEEQLIDKDLFSKNYKSLNILTYGEHLNEFPFVSNTEFVLKSNTNKLFSNLLSMMPREAPRYFRPQEVEFQKSLK